jgi:hypothetical protein
MKIYKCRVTCDHIAEFLMASKQAAYPARTRENMCPLCVCEFVYLQVKLHQVSLHLITYFNPVFVFYSDV